MYQINVLLNNETATIIIATKLNSFICCCTIELAIFMLDLSQ